MSNKRSILFVCLGNTCRSPMAEAIFIDCIKELDMMNNWEADSAALRNYHIGKSPNPRTEVTLRLNGIINYSHKARIIRDEDFNKFNWILGMDEFNIDELNIIKPLEFKAKIELLGKYNPDGEEIIIIEDPYLDPDITGFLQVFQQCKNCIKHFLDINN